MRRTYLRCRSLVKPPILNPQKRCTECVHAWHEEDVENILCSKGEPELHRNNGPEMHVLSVNTQIALRCRYFEEYVASTRGSRYR